MTVFLEQFGNIKKVLNDVKEGKDITFDQLFINLGVSEDYILAIKLSNHIFKT